MLRPETSRRLSSYLVSLMVHLLVLIGLALVFTALPELPGPIALRIANPSVDEAELETVTPATEQVAMPLTAAVELPAASALETLPTPVSPEEIGAASTSPQPPTLVREAARELLLPSSAPLGGGVQGRAPESRAQLAAARGGNAASENAVGLALEWIVAHQRPDGSWRFDHDGPRCQGECRHPGTAPSTTGSTGLALLALLGAGHTHQQGAYAGNVESGLYYLTSRMLVTPHGGDLQEGTMYAQGIATLALTEAYAMSQDPNLRQAAQQAVNFICRAQHAQGGWRYYPGQPGDTTVFGWQFMALKSARLAGLEVPSPVIDLAAHYLDSVQAEEGAFYGYQKPAKTPTPTAVGLLSRMYLGWPRTRAPLIRGVEFLGANGPSPTDMYFNYYATQVLCHYGGHTWPSWNSRMRDHLIRTQAQEGHERGSWYFEDKHGAVGGRLYTTAMCAMILEVYYRYMPLYTDTVSEFPF